MNRTPNADLDLTVQQKGNGQIAGMENHVDNGSIGLHWVDANGIIKWANRAELGMLGYNDAEYIGHHISEFHMDQDKIKDILTRLNCNEPLDHYESILRC